MPTADDVKKAGHWGPIGVRQRELRLSYWQSDTFQGNPLGPGDWFHVYAGYRTVGFVNLHDDAMYAWPVASLENGGLARVVHSFDDALLSLVDQDD